MANKYATEFFLRKQVRLRDKRIKELESAVQAAAEFLQTIVDDETWSFRDLEQLQAHLREDLAAPAPEGWEKHV